MSVASITDGAQHNLNSVDRAIKLQYDQSDVHQYLRYWYDTDWCHMLQWLKRHTVRHHWYQSVLMLLVIGKCLNTQNRWKKCKFLVISLSFVYFYQVYYTPGIYVEGYIVFVFPFVRLCVCSFVSSFVTFVEFTLKSFSSGVCLTNHSSEAIHIWTIGTLVHWKVCYHAMSFGPRVLAPERVLEVKI